jgi:DNA-binding transcriptional ArsR family regulator
MDQAKQNSEKFFLSLDDRADEILNNPVKKAILELLHKSDGSHFGDLIESLNYPYDIILQNLLELKQEGIIRKESSVFMIN